jgi:tetratricopeptide (TPR) repeat protein
MKPKELTDRYNQELETLYVQCNIEMLIDRCHEILSYGNIAEEVFIAKYYLAKAHEWKGDYMQALEIAIDLYKQDNTFSDTEKEVQILNLLGYLYRITGYYEKAFSNYIEPALKKAQKLNNRRYMLESIIEQALYEKTVRKDDKANKTIGNIKFLIVNIKDSNILALGYYHMGILEKAYKLYQSSGNKRGMAAALNAQVYLLPGNEREKRKMLLRKACKLYEETGCQAEIPTCLSKFGWEYLEEKDYSEALNYFRKALKLSQELGNKAFIMQSYSNLAKTYYNKSDMAKAITYYQKSLQVATDLEDYFAMSNLNRDIGQALFFSNKYQEAFDKFSVSGQIYLGLNKGAKMDIATIAYWIGRTEAKLDHHKQAIGYYQTALSTFSEKKSLIDISDTYYMLGVSFLKIKDKGEASTNFREGLKYAKELNDMSRMASFLEYLMFINWSEKNHKEAIIFCQDLIDVNTKLERKEQLAKNYTDLGMLQMLLKNYSEMIEAYSLALDIYQLLKNEDRISNCLSNIGEAHYFLMENKKAIKFLKEAVKIQRSLQLDEPLANNYYLLGDIYFEMDDHKESVNYFQKAAKIYSINHHNDKFESFTEDILKKEAYCNRKAGEYYLFKENSALAIVYYKNLLENYIELEDDYFVADAHFLLGNSYMIDFNDIDKAIMYFKKARDYYENNREPSSLEIRASINESIGMLYVQKGQNKKAGSYFLFAQIGYEKLKDQKSLERIRDFQRRFRY